MSLVHPDHDVDLCPVRNDLPQDIIGLESKALSPPCPEYLSYQYQPLPREDCIRLLWLFPGEDDKVLSCRLLSVPLGEAPPYEALSYVWGDPTNTAEIICGQKKLSVTINLRDALRRFRLKKDYRVLWADAICIHQQNITERKQQIQLMGMIYWKADRVLVWLGQNIERDKSINPGDAFAWIREYNRIFHEKEKVFGDAHKVPPITSDDLAQLTESEVDRWEAVSALLSNPWFGRVWVMQEVGLAADALFFCGDAEIEAIELLEFFLSLLGSGQALYDHFSLNLSQVNIWTEYWTITRPEYMSIAEKSPDLSFVQILADARHLNATDPRDYIFAFLGHPTAMQFPPGQEARAGMDYGSIMSLKIGLLIQPDYTKSVQEVYTEFAVKILETTNSIYLLSYIIHFEKSIEENIPSWVPRWNLPGVYQNSLGTHPEERYYDASRGSCSRSPTFVESNKLNGLSGLQLNALFVDRIEWTYEFSAHDWAYFAFLEYDLGEGSTIYRNPIEDIWSQLSHHTVLTSDEEKNSLMAFGLTMTAGWLGDKPAEDEPEKFFRNFYAYRLRKSWKSGPRLPTSSLSHFIQAARGGDPHRFEVDVRTYTKSRTFFRTQTGLIGLGPQPTKKGDVCFILLGANTPFVLRPTSLASHYRILGEVYVHGIMRGESMAAEYSNKVEDIILC
ncbi:HET-domain-containing protein [Glonium stellatum]|uniref:HET-domain-containing protein n=1 Tax=Glonium stellatum TaxID=574774 RepID=A0A8E2F4J8_9PEZI|nr:HET-domain-containing protein [Glonium stellatum]